VYATAGTFTVTLTATDGYGASSSATTTATIGSQTTPPPPPPPSGSSSEIVVYASDLPASARHGTWTSASDAGSPNALKLSTADAGWESKSKPAASPVNYVDVPFSAPAGVRYNLWLRLKAAANSGANDAVWVQFSDSLVNGVADYRMQTTAGLQVNLEASDTSGLSGWGWTNGSYWLTQPTVVTFAASGAHTLRIQVREDGVEFDQIVLSPAQFLNTAPGPAVNDNTIVPKPSGGSTQPPPSSNPNIVVYASDTANTSLFGGWTRTTGATGSPNSTKLVTADRAWAAKDAPLASPVDYMDVTFTAAAGTPYTVWLRLQATANSGANDAAWVQFSDALVNGAAAYRWNTTSGLLVNLESSDTAGLSGWGWTNGAYWLVQPTTVTFATTGTHTIRIQVREDGVQLDQIVLSPTTYLNGAPGAKMNDTTIVPK
jgi:hypothetical protein